MKIGRIESYVSRAAAEEAASKYAEKKNSDFKDKLNNAIACISQNSNGARLINDFRDIMKGHDIQRVAITDTYISIVVDCSDSIENELKLLYSDYNLPAFVFNPNLNFEGFCAFWEVRFTLITAIHTLMPKYILTASSIQYGTTWDTKTFIDSSAFIAGCLADYYYSYSHRPYIPYSSNPVWEDHPYFEYGLVTANGWYSVTLRIPEDAWNCFVLEKQKQPLQSKAGTPDA